MRTLGRMRGRPCTQPFLVESLRGSRQSPQRNFSPAPLGKSIAPSSVTLVTASPKGKPLGRAALPEKKRPKSGHADGCRNSPSTGTMWHPTPKRASGNERVINRGSRGQAPGLFLRLSPEKAGLPARESGGNHLAGANLRRSKPGPPADGVGEEDQLVRPQSLAATARAASSALQLKGRPVLPAAMGETTGRKSPSSRV